MTVSPNTRGNSQSLGVSPKKTQKTKPLKKIPQTDAIFENVFRENQASDENPKSLRVSIDTKAKVKIGNLSRGGKARTLKAKAADDHDTHWEGATRFCEVGSKISDR
ncbi:ISAzo13-like element transposase-related protein [Nostoc sp.]|uniref:ISAzo13-like element transposase-related protein n=1 Tax=Nostoc sp. TaxID=1180 RepID=UPI002FF91C05